MAVRAAATSERKRAILEAALAIFLERGYDATTVEEIRDRSGASIGSLYHHFGGGKEAIAGAIYVEALGDYQAGVLRVLERDPPARDGIRGVVRFHLAWIAEHPEWARFLFRMRGADGVKAVEPTLAEMNERMLSRVGAWIERHRRAGAVAKLPGDLWYALWLGPAQEFGRLWLAGRSETSPQRAAGTLADAAWRAVRGPRS